MSVRWRAGRAAHGRRILRNRGRLLNKARLQKPNYWFRDMRLSFIAGLSFRSATNKLFSLVCLSSGSMTYVPTAANHQIFRIFRFRNSFQPKKPKPSTLYDYYTTFSQVFFLIHQLPKNQAVCLLEIRPGRGIQYIRAAGSRAKILRMDSRISTSLILLPSGVRKIFSMYGLGSDGTVALPSAKKMKNNKAGAIRQRGRKSIVRGVAMNPVDHPHGGRTKAIAHPRTPWGTTAKLK